VSRIVGVLIGIGLAVLGAWVSAYQASARIGHSQVLRVRWHLFGNEGPVALWGDGRFVFAQFSNSGRDVLIDDQTGRRTDVQVPPGCGPAPVAMGGPFLLFACGNGAAPMRLYRVSLPRGWRALNPSPQFVQQCNSPDVGRCGPTAIGSHWVEYGMTTCEDPGVHCSSPRYEFQNIDTGQLAANPATPGGTVIPDLNSPTLAHKLCSPLQVPSAQISPYDPGPSPGTVTLYGRFAVSSLDYGAGQGEAHLHKCGSQLDQQLIDLSNPTSPPIGNTHVLVWSPGLEPNGQYPHQLNAVRLPSLRRLVIPVPPTIGGSSTLVLGPRHLYMIGAETQDLYTTPSRVPTNPRAQR
jgi:hypothetical protein